MYGIGRTHLRAVMAVGTNVAVGILLLVTAADGGTLAPPAPTSAPTTVAEQVPPTPAPAPCTDPVSGGPGLQLPAPDRTALLIGDSQSGGAAGVPADRTWTQAGIRSAGYDVRFVGAGGTGFVAANSGAANYPSALTNGQWVLPCADPALIVIEGGGNDATQGATDAQITAGADAVVSTLARTYPSAKIAMIGTLARGAAYGGGRRTAVDGVLSAVAANHHVAFVSAGDWLSRYQASTLLADAVHLTQAGHDRLARVLGSQLKNLHLTASDLARARLATSQGGR